MASLPRHQASMSIRRVRIKKTLAVGPLDVLCSGIYWNAEKVIVPGLQRLLLGTDLPAFAWEWGSGLRTVWCVRCGGEGYTVRQLYRVEPVLVYSLTLDAPDAE